MDVTRKIQTILDQLNTVMVGKPGQVQDGVAVGASVDMGAPILDPAAIPVVTDCKHHAQVFAGQRVGLDRLKGAFKQIIARGGAARAAAQKCEQHQ